MLFEDVAAQQPFARNMESFLNPKITKDEVRIKGGGGSPINSSAKGCALINSGARQRNSSQPAASVIPRWPWSRKTLVSPTYLWGSSWRPSSLCGLTFERPRMSSSMAVALVCRQTGCGKTVFILDLLEGPYRGFFGHIVVLCPTIKYNKTYQRPWIWTDPEVYF